MSSAVPCFRTSSTCSITRFTSLEQFFGIPCSTGLKYCHYLS
jgi:hypothetical protein